MNVTADVVIIGAGITGTSAAYQLARRGLQVIVVEKRFLGAGSTGKSSAIIRQHYSNEITARMALHSLRVFQDFANVVGGEAGFVRTGFAILVDDKDRDGLAENVELQQGVGVKTSLISTDELRAIDPNLSFAERVAVAYEPESGYADPVATTTSYAEAARRCGAQIWQETSVERVLMDAGRVSGVETTRGRISAPNVINCANAWAPSIARTVGVNLPIHTERHQVSTFQSPAQGERPRVTVADLIHQIYYRPEGAQLTLVGTLTPAEEVNPDDYKESVDENFITDTGERLAARYPIMERALSRRGYAGIYGVTPDWHPIIDEVPGGSGFFVAAGFSGHGFKLGPAVGVLIADMVTRARVPTEGMDRALFHYSRFAQGNPIRGKYEYGIAG